MEPPFFMQRRQDGLTAPLRRERGACTRLFGVQRGQESFWGATPGIRQGRAAGTDGRAPQPGRTDALYSFAGLRYMSFS